MKVVIVKEDGKTVYAAKVDDIDEIEYLKQKRSAATNRRLKEEELKIAFDKINLELAQIRAEIRHLKGEE